MAGMTYKSTVNKTEVHKGFSLYRPIFTRLKLCLKQLKAIPIHLVAAIANTVYAIISPVIALIKPEWIDEDE